MYRTATFAENQSGFTMIELMIATVVFSLVLLVMTFGVLSFTHAYYAGVNSSTTQNTTRQILSTITQAVEFSGTNIATTADTTGDYFCAGGYEFIFKPGVLYSGGSPTAKNPGLFAGLLSTGGCPSPTGAIFENGKQLLAPNMRVAALTVTWSPPRLYTISLRVTFGSSDLLCNTSKDGSPGGGGCLPTDPSYPAGINVEGTDVACRQQVGSQFCAFSGLTTTVSSRVAESDLSS